MLPQSHSFRCGLETRLAFVNFWDQQLTVPFNVLSLQA